MNLGRIFTAGSLRRKLLLILLAIFIPALGIILASGLSYRQHEIADAQKDALLLVRSLAAQQEKIVLTTKTLLSTLAQLPELQRLDAPACNRIFRELHQQYPFYSGIAAATPDGHVFAASSPFAPNLNLSDRKHFQDAIRTLDFSVGEYATGRISKTVMISYSLPVLYVNKKLMAVLMASFNLNAYALSLSEFKLPEGSAVSFHDHNGVRVYRMPQHEATAVGKPALPGFMAHISGRLEEGVFDWLANDGIKRIYAFKQMRLRENLPPYLYMTVGLPKDRILHAANLKILGNLAILGIAALLALSLAWLLGNQALIKPIDRLIAAVQQFGMGKLEARTNLPNSTDELGRLAQAFDDMAALLERKDQERKQAEEALSQAYVDLERRVQERTVELSAVNAALLKSAEQQRLLASIVEFSEDAIIGKDLQGIILSWNAGAERLYGYTAGEALGQPIDLIIPPGHLEESQQILTQVSQGLRVEHYETMRLRKDGQQVQISLTVSPIKDAVGEIVGASSIARDIREHKRMEKELLKEKTVYETLIDSLPGIFYFFDEQHHWVRWNQNLELVTGYSRAELPRLSPVDFFGGEDKDRVARTIQKVFLSGDADVEAEMLSRDDKKTPYFFTGKRIDLDGKPHLISVGVDIAERKRAEEQLQVLSAYARSLIEASLDPLVTISPEGKITDVNRATEEATGIDRGHLIGSDFSDYFTEPDKARGGYQQVLAHGLVRDYPLVLRHTPGQVMEVLYNATTYTNEAVEVQGVFAAARDVTERNEAERQVQRLNEEWEQRVRERTAQLEAANQELEAFSYSVSHDLRAPLRSMSGFSHILLEKYREALDEQGQDYLGRIVAASKRMGQLIDDILKLSRLGRAEMTRQKVDLSASARGILAELRQQQPARQVELDIADGLTAYGDPNLVQVILKNLLQNAWKFTSQKPQAKIEVGVTERDGARVIYVRDNGAGFDMAYVERLFGAFQRLHQATEFPGTGIGLAIVKRIVHRHGGQVWAEGAVGQGAIFYFTLP